MLTLRLSLFVTRYSNNDKRITKNDIFTMDPRLRGNDKREAEMINERLWYI